MKNLNIRTKIMIWFTLLSALLLGILVPTVYTTVSASLQQSLQADLQIALSQVFASLESKDGTLSLNLEELDLQDNCGFAVFLPDGENLYTSPTAGWLKEQQLTCGENTILANDQKWAVEVQNFEIDEIKVVIAASSSMRFVEDSLYDLTLLLLLLIPIYLGISALGSFFLAKRAMRPIRQITKTAQTISNGDMSSRICDVNARDEVGELADTFNGMLDTLEESFKRERRFTSDASHELRTPLAVITSCTEDALSDKDTNCLENLEIIKNEAERMTKIISQLLMLSRGYEGRCHFEPDQILLYDMVDSVAEEFAGMADAAHIRIHNNIDKDMEIRADQSLMTQLFVNLIGNGIKYGSKEGNIWLSATECGNQVQIKVVDDGIGISPEDQTHVFERFYRADKARDRSGSGLGLAIAKWIVELHHGALTLCSTLGQGSTFVISMPK